ncbi:hypothetical protein [Mesorhizobium silamurunense]|uniref:hypothetical protein n=1 Tax=Mesorhizobium silamurunense TaxID=499528 RepID=UPI0017849CB4|nr:hypothetical protein [Mesorhizobium silamurunense]
MVEIFSFELAKARQRVKRAERSLNRANELLDDDSGGVALNLALCCRIRSEQTRVIDARSRLLKINPTVHS